MADLLIHDLAEVATPNGTLPRRRLTRRWPAPRRRKGPFEVATPNGTLPRRGADQRRVSRLRGAEVLCRDGRIAYKQVGPITDETLPELTREIEKALRAS